MCFIPDKILAECSKLPTRENILETGLVGHIQEDNSTCNAMVLKNSVHYDVLNHINSCILVKLNATCVETNEKGIASLRHNLRGRMQ